MIRMDEVPVEQVRWIWPPYIPAGKITIVQGDPGEGKTTFVLALAALLTRGEPLPGSTACNEPINVIYQTAEDGLADTIKPRLLAAGADCSRVLVIDESAQELTLNDERLELAVQRTGAKLVILDPLQAYLGGGVDMHRANEVRPIFKRLAAMGERTGCAVILIGHMNKAQGAKGAYRGLGSIDFRAAARSVLLVGRARDDQVLRIVAHDKSSLAPEGQSIAFEIGENGAVVWRGFCDVTADALLSGVGAVQTKTARAEDMLRDLLTSPMSSGEVFRRAAALGISERTVKNAKHNVGVITEKQGGQWVCHLP